MGVIFFFFFFLDQNLSFFILDITFIGRLLWVNSRELLFCRCESWVFSREGRS